MQLEWIAATVQACFEKVTRMLRGGGTVAAIFLSACPACDASCVCVCAIPEWDRMGLDVAQDAHDRVHV